MADKDSGETGEPSPGTEGGADVNMRRRAWGPALWAAAVLAIAAEGAFAAESPKSYGAAARVDTPILRIPFATKKPKIDGVIEQGEWEDASALSGFWYDFTTANFRFLAPIQTQLQVYAAFDNENLYLAYSSPVYPEGSWLRARGRFPDVLSHPLYGVLWDDHVEIEFRPYHDAARGFRLGLLRWDVNPINTVVDWNWTQQYGHEMKWQSRAKVICASDARRWTIEIAAPLKELVTHGYAGKDKQGSPLVVLPPPDGTAYRCWFVRGIGGNGRFFNCFDAHIWNTTKTKMIFDRKAVGFQINELGPIMEDVIDLHLTVKNHNQRSETVQLGFFVENAHGLIYSSYDSAVLKGGLLELRPGEVRKLNLRQHFPGITANGNVLWFDVRSAGRPAKALFRTRLIRFHSMEGGEVRGIPFRTRRLEVIAGMRPPRKAFDFRHEFSSYTKRVSAIVDLGIAGASEEARSAVDAKLLVMTADENEDVVAESTVPVKGNFACFVLDLPRIVEGESYKLSMLLFDRNKRVVGEANPPPFTYEVPVWQNNEHGKDDTVAEPFTAIRRTDGGLETLKHCFTLSPSGLPAQLFIRPDPRELPLEKRGDPGKLTDADLMEIGRGRQLRAPMRLEAMIGGKRVRGEVTAPARLIRKGKSEFEYRAKLRFGKLPVELITQYDCDGSIHCRLAYGEGGAPANVELLELVTDVEGYVDLVTSGDGGMAGADVWECGLPDGEGVVWDSAGRERAELYYSHFIPWFWFGSADRAFSFYCDLEKGWALDRDGPGITLERDKAGKVTWRVKFVNHPVTVTGRREVAFSILNHPAKSKPAKFRELAWHYCGSWANGYAVEPIEIEEATLRKNWRRNAGAPRDWPEEKITEWRKDDPPWFRHGRWRNVGTSPELDQIWEDKATYWYEKRIRIGRRVGGWWDEYWPCGFGRSDNLAMGNAYLRDPDEIGKDELPWHRGYLTKYMRGFYQRIGHEYARNNVPNRNCTWANNASNMGESYLWDTMLVEECGAGNRSYDVDVVIQFPNSLYRCMAKNYTGLVCRLFADASPAGPGDSKHFDRQWLGRALLNDIGVNSNGPHGIVRHKEQVIRLLQRLTEFGYFRDEGMERIPHWRIKKFVRIGKDPSAKSQVWVTVYRRPLDDGKGCKALFVIMNESDDPVELPLHVVDPQRILGGRNTLQSGAVLAKAEVPEALKGWWSPLAGSHPDAVVLMDFETGEIVPRQEGEEETYGPVYVPYHDYRVLYAEHRESE